jgi:5'-nucleotidase
LRILVTNDDSINAPGLWAVVESLTELGQVSVVAPDRDQSGIGTARTLLNVLRVSEVETRVPGVPAYTVSGTPSDCVILATSALFDEPFDLVVSGINEGANLGLDVLDSGTAGGAFRGYFRGIPSIAMSVTAVTGVRYDTAARVASSLVESLDGEQRPLVYNVNVPNVPQDRLRGVKETFLGPKAWLEGVQRGHDGRRTHYWISHNQPTNADVPKGCDVWATRNNWISITPIDLGAMARDGSGELAGLAAGVARAMGLDGSG